MSTTPVWADSKFAAFFRRAEATIAECQRQLAAPWLAEREERYHRMILEICGVEVEEPAAA